MTRNMSVITDQRSIEERAFLDSKDDVILIQVGISFHLLIHGMFSIERFFCDHHGCIKSDKEDVMGNKMRGKNSKYISIYDNNGRTSGWTGW